MNILKKLGDLLVQAVDTVVEALSNYVTWLAEQLWGGHLLRDQCCVESDHWRTDDAD